MYRLIFVLLLLLTLPGVTEDSKTQGVKEALTFREMQVLLGPGVVPKVDELMKSCKRVREFVVEMLGFEMPGVTFSDDSTLKKDEYVIKVAEIEVKRGRFKSVEEFAESLMLDVVVYSGAIFDREYVLVMLQEQKSDLPAGPVHQVMRNLLREFVSVAQPKPILEVVAANPKLHPDALTELARARLNVAERYVVNGTMNVTTVDPELEKRLQAATKRSETGEVTVEFDGSALKEPDDVVVIADALRLPLHRVLPGAIVLAKSEVPAQVKLNPTGVLK